MQIEPPKQNVTLKLPITCSKSNTYPSRCSTELVHGNTPKILSINRKKHLLAEVYAKSKTKSFQHVTKEYNHHEFAIDLPALSSAATNSVENLNIIVSHTANDSNPTKEHKKYPYTLVTVTNNKQTQLAPTNLIIDENNHNETKIITHSLDSSNGETRSADEIHIQAQKKTASTPERNVHLLKEIEDSALNNFDTNAIYTQLTSRSKIIVGSHATVTKDIK